MTGSAGQNSSNATKLLATPDSDGPLIFTRKWGDHYRYSDARVLSQRALWSPIQYAPQIAYMRRKTFGVLVSRFSVGFGIELSPRYQYRILSMSSSKTF